MRELKQSGLDYDLAYKNAVLSWEIEKQALMADWDAELQGIKRGMASEEETLDLLAVEVSKRSIVLLESKTALALEMEAYKKTLADLEGDVSPYEVQLANGKLLTAQKKLELLPIVEVILTKEQELLAIEQSKAAAYTALMAAESAVSAKKETLTPVLNDLATKSKEYATLITTDQIPKEELITDEKISQAQAAVTKSGYQVQELTADIETETKHLELMGEKRALQETQFGLEQSLTQHEKELTATYQGDVMADFSETLESERATATQVIDDKTTAEATRNATKLTSTNTLTNGRKSEDATKTIYSNNGLMNKTAIDAKAKLTANLTHILA